MLPPEANATAGAGPAGSARVSTFERDRRLIAAWQRGDRDAGAMLMDDYCAFTQKVARRLGIRDEHDFLDFWQELLLRVLGHLPHLEQRVHKSFAGYLAWHARDLASRFRARRNVALAVPDPAVDDEDPVERGEFWRAIATCEAALPAGERPVFALRFREGLSLAEVAERTLSNANAVAQAIFRLVRRMRACLAHKGFGFGEDDS
jgi:RNA polymerase sigma factor (sigma-70 family)